MFVMLHSLFLGSGWSFAMRRARESRPQKTGLQALSF
jgi:hypothetical protein